jgi:hypothetical protein
MSNDHGMNITPVMYFSQWLINEPNRKAHTMKYVGSRTVVTAAGKREDRQRNKVLIVLIKTKPVASETTVLSNRQISMIPGLWERIELGFRDALKEIRVLTLNFYIIKKKAWIYFHVCYTFE